MANRSLNLVRDKGAVSHAPGGLTISAYDDITRLVERLHRRHLDVIRLALSRAGTDDINAVQALLLLNVQDAEVSIRELVDRGYYIGSNVTYNVRHLVETGHLEQNRSERDRRSVKIKLSEKGRGVCKTLAEMEARHAETLIATEGPNADVESARRLLRSLERVWSDSIHYGGME